jgi:hypothetical protein
MSNYYTVYVCVRACLRVRASTLQLLNQLTDSDEILYELYAIEEHLNTTFLIP